MGSPALPPHRGSSWRHNAVRRATRARGIVVVVLLTSRAAVCEAQATIEPFEAWSKIYGAAPFTRHVMVKSERGVAARVQWRFSLGERTEMLIGGLSKHAELRVVERGRVESVLNENQAGKGGLIDPATVQRAGSELAADYLLTGSLAGTEGKVTITATLTRMGAAKPRGEWSVSGPSDKLFELESDLAGQIRREIGLPEAAVDRTPTVAVLGFKDLSPKPRLKEMESGFSEILQTELAGLEGFRVVERAQLDAVLEEQKLPLSGLAVADLAVKIGKLLGANRLVFGSFLELGINLRVEARLVDTETAAVLKAETAREPTEQFAVMFEDLALRLARGMTARPQTQGPAQDRAARTTRKLEAARHYAAGREALRLDRYTDAAAAFERALLLEPDNLDTHYYRIDALDKARDYPRVVDAARQALNRTFTPRQEFKKASFTNWLAQGYFQKIGPEKILALFHAAVAAGVLGRAEESRRYYQVIQEAPSIVFPSHDERAAWAPAWWDPKSHRIQFSDYASQGTASVWAKQPVTRGP